MTLAASRAVRNSQHISASTNRVNEVVVEVAVDLGVVFLRLFLAGLLLKLFDRADDLVARGGGLILNTASISGHLEFLPLRTAAHGACKAGVMGLTRMMAAEGSAHNIRAISISPGLIKSPATANDDQPGPTRRRQTCVGGDAVQSVPIRVFLITLLRFGPRKPLHITGSTAGTGAGSPVLSTRTAARGGVGGSFATAAGVAGVGFASGTEDPGGGGNVSLRVAASSRSSAVGFHRHVSWNPPSPLTPSVRASTR